MQYFSDFLLLPEAVLLKPQGASSKRRVPSFDPRRCLIKATQQLLGIGLVLFHIPCSLQTNFLVDWISLHFAFPLESGNY
ncbi:hypothetical protein QQP08_020379 [Theobroma cacao]|nr:hypothetical protein QQP08_020379 [Theobroma cacao]